MTGLRAPHRRGGDRARGANDDGPPAADRWAAIVVERGAPPPLPATRPRHPSPLHPGGPGHQVHGGVASVVTQVGGSVKGSVQLTGQDGSPRTRGCPCHSFYRGGGQPPGRPGRRGPGRHPGSGPPGRCAVVLHILLNISTVCTV